MTNAPGTPIWYELLTSDVEAAKRFYGEIVGWTAQAFPSPGSASPYTVFNAGEAGVAGLMQRPDDAPTGPAWLTYFYVEDVDAKVAEAQAAGAQVYMAGTDLPGVGRIAFLADPQGAPFYLMKPAPPPGDDRDSVSFSPTLRGSCSWNELATSDQKAALGFYGALLGWTSTEAMPMGEMGDYTFVDNGDLRLGAMLDRQSADQPVKWTFYFAIPDVDAAVEQVTALGGQVVMGPMDVPGGQRIIVAIDPQGASVGFVSGERQ